MSENFEEAKILITITANNDIIVQSTENLDLAQRANLLAIAFKLESDKLERFLDMDPATGILPS